jgi:hypothetical protein
VRQGPTAAADPRREIGPIGTASRIAGGVAFIVVPIALHGIGLWDVGAALVGFPSLAFLAAAPFDTGSAPHAATSTQRSAAVRHVQAAVVLALVLGIATAVTFVTPVDGVAIWSFLGVSMLVAAYRGYGGCEVLAIPHAFNARVGRIECILYAPIDVAERHRASRSS